jgi:hypothetical protein
MIMVFQGIRYFTVLLAIIPCILAGIGVQSPPSFARSASGAE